MQLFACPDCGNRVYFENHVCASCNAQLVFDPAEGEFAPDRPICANRSKIGCNWAASGESEYCHSCQMTDVTPDLGLAKNVALWAEGEEDKRWVLYGLGHWGWFGPSDPGQLPVFHFKSETTRRGNVPVVMGHANGVITINVMEADPVIRTRRRELLDEDYRTMMGHHRHELAHYLFIRLSEFDGFLDEFRRVFGDEREDYGAALQRHYAEGPPLEWQNSYVTPYATAHPHEDWAETVAHILHLTDILDSAVAVGVAHAAAPERPDDPYATRDADQLIDASVDLGLALNHVNRSMGLPDLYPFVLSNIVRDKLACAHHWLTVQLSDAA